MKPANSTGHVRKRLVILNEVQVESIFRQSPPAPKLRKETALVREFFWAEQQYIGKIGEHNVHWLSSSILTGLYDINDEIARFGDGRSCRVL